MDYRAFVEEQIAEIRKEVGEGTAINALSGGVDSSVVTALGFRALGPAAQNGFYRQRPHARRRAGPGG